MSIIERHPGFSNICNLAAHVLDQHAPPGAPDYWSWSPADALILELHSFLTIKQLVLRTRPTDNNNVDDPLSVSPGFLVDALWHAVLPCLWSQRQVSVMCSSCCHIAPACCPAAALCPPPFCSCMRLVCIPTPWLQP